MRIFCPAGANKISLRRPHHHRVTPCLLIISSHSTLRSNFAPFTVHESCALPRWAKADTVYISAPLPLSSSAHPSIPFLLFDDSNRFWFFRRVSGSDGEDEFKAILAELLHNEREREAEEEGAASEPGEPGAAI